MAVVAENTGHHPPRRSEGTRAVEGRNASSTGCSSPRRGCPSSSAPRSSWRCSRRRSCSSRRCRSTCSGPAAGCLATTSSICPRSSSGPLPSRASRWLVAIPVGLGAAIYLAEYSAGRLRRVLKPILETLAGVPSVVMGFFALSVISPDFVKKLFSSAGTFSLLAAGIGVGILTVPLVASVAEDAMYAVPGALREAAYGIGARRRSVTTKVVFPAAASGVAAAVILGISRAIGETMVVAIAAGGTGGLAADLRPPRSRADDDGRHLVARGRVRPGRGRRRSDAQPLRGALPGRSSCCSSSRWS